MVDDHDDAGDDDGWMMDVGDDGGDDDDDAHVDDDDTHHQLNVSQCPPLAALHQPKELSSSTHNSVRGVRITHPSTPANPPFAIVRGVHPWRKACTSAAR